MSAKHQLVLQLLLLLMVKLLQLVWLQTMIKALLYLPGPNTLGLLTWLLHAGTRFGQ